MPSSQQPAQRRGDKRSAAPHDAREDRAHESGPPGKGAGSHSHGTDKGRKGGGRGGGTPPDQRPDHP
ncbi:hypothetical protein [Streptomyces sp. NPDC007088]|uniref:hypothetical protein n=1 Tax=Streptomyces sp. NPDC007088 TaxID=3364773 RepID=UPI0036CA75C8